MIHRRDLLLALLAVSPTPVWAAPCPPPKVLFVCPAGTVKSAIARETLKRRAAERGVAVRAVSRGVHPEDHVSPGLAANLKVDGIDPRVEPVHAFTPADLTGVTVVVAFDEAALAPGLAQARPWDIPSWNSDYDHAKAVLAVKIEALLDEFAARRCGQALSSADDARRR